VAVGGGGSERILRAAREMVSRAQALLGSNLPAKVLGGTFHSSGTG
jgi:superfamily I DNA/RNA helicase